MSNDSNAGTEISKPCGRGYWSDVRLNRDLVACGIVKLNDFSSKRVEAAAYRLRVGEEIYITPVPGDNDSRNHAKRYLKEREAVAIPPGQFAILCTEERVTIPTTATAFITLRMKPKLRGLINVSGFHVAPGYRGRILFSVFNAGPSEVHVARGDEWFMISFLDLDHKAESPRDPDDGYDGIPTEFTSALSSEFLTLKTLDSKIGAIEREQAILRWASALILAGLIAFGAKQCSSDSGHASTAQISQPAERPV